MHACIWNCLCCFLCAVHSLSPEQKLLMLRFRAWSLVQLTQFLISTPARDAGFAGDWLCSSRTCTAAAGQDVLTFGNLSRLLSKCTGASLHKYSTAGYSHPCMGRVTICGRPHFYVASEETTATGCRKRPSPTPLVMLHYRRFFLPGLASNCKSQTTVKIPRGHL